MKMLKRNKVVAWMLAVCLLLGGVAGAMAEMEAPVATLVPASPSEFEALGPLMDAVVGAVMAVSEEPETIYDEEAKLILPFVDAFFRVGAQNPALGITADMLQNPQAQAEYLGKVFGAQLPELEAVAPVEPSGVYNGFCPKTVNMGAEGGGIQIIGEMYSAPKPLKELTEAEYQQVVWRDSAGFTFQEDTAAANGYRLMSFFLGRELTMELAMQNYYEQLLVEYVNNNLGFQLQYPSVFTDDLLVEDQDGLSAEMPDGSASFFAKRVENANQANLRDYVEVIANGLNGAVAQFNDQAQYGTITYAASPDQGQAGYNVFDMYVVTDNYIYQAELRYKTELADKFSMFTRYLENSFQIDEVSVG